MFTINCSAMVSKKSSLKETKPYSVMSSSSVWTGISHIPESNFHDSSILITSYVLDEENKSKQSVDTKIKIKYHKLQKENLELKKKNSELQDRNVELHKEKLKLDENLIKKAKMILEFAEETKQKNYEILAVEKELRCVTDQKNNQINQLNIIVKNQDQQIKELTEQLNNYTKQSLEIKNSKQEQFVVDKASEKMKDLKSLDLGEKKLYDSVIELAQYTVEQIPLEFIILEASDSEELVLNERKVICKETYSESLTIEALSLLTGEQKQKPKSLFKCCK